MTKWVCVRKEDELQHWGIKGQRWGVRRYQNADGSLTAAGRKRYRDDAADIERELSGVRKAGVDEYQTALRATKSAGETVDAARKLKNDADKIKDPKMEKRIRKNVSEMSDQELQRAVQRMNMEDNYTRMMMNREHLEKGEGFVNKVLNVSSVALRGATTALTIAYLVKQLQG